ncbi:helix-turn-helix domain-containing protein [Acetobacter sp. TBRC 12305]|uniref:Helix-turn-helix domain-containing protein n=1 Tax=Acetobacter garciniae TaxID=2817435 RepID=A0A939HN89_9PROT|nr:helix-turn-helix domain-containing protein [Acetobacter garciniae]MBX0345457.1 helix-turn-helix domain-containing protein [Acetobacter garciniae]
MSIKAIIKRAGGASTVARLLGIHHSAVVRWEKVPDGRVVALEAATGIPREELRPDLFKRTPAEGVGG